MVSAAGSVSASEPAGKRRQGLLAKTAGGLQKTELVGKDRKRPAENRACGQRPKAACRKQSLWAKTESGLQKTEPAGKDSKRPAENKPADKKPQALDS
ncbi:hypothetical protein D7X48_03705 [bacterium D16-50]|nr:hypothetical protein D7X48_03705 [bacterium D16-50]